MRPDGIARMIRLGGLAGREENVMLRSAGMRRPPLRRIISLLAAVKFFIVHLDAATPARNSATRRKTLFYTFYFALGVLVNDRLPSRSLRVRAKT